MSMKLLHESEQQSQNMLDSQSSQFFQNQDSYTPFLEQLFDEKSELEKSIEANLQEAERQYQKMMTSRIPQYFQESYSVPPPHNEQPSTLETSKELLRESEPQS